MDTTELNNTRKELVKWIQSLTDLNLLQLLATLKLSTEGNKSDWWEELTEIDKSNILVGIKNYNLKETMSSEEFWENLRI
ncbi:MAG: hypothetical protein AAFX53_18220 [Bacteroidota bacterium]